MLKAIIASIIAGIILIAIGFLAKKRCRHIVKRKILKSLTKKSLTDVCKYNSVKKKMQKLLGSSKVGKLKSQSALRIICVKGKDITNDLQEGIENFLKNNGEVLILVLDPNSRYAKDRSDELEREVCSFRKSIQQQIDMIKNEYSAWKEKGKLTIKKYNYFCPLRMNFIGDNLFVGFYNERLSDYENVWCHILDRSALYNALEQQYNEICTNWSTDA